MHYVFKIGPVETAQGEQTFFFVDEDGESVSTYMAGDDEDGLRQAAKGHPGKTLYCNSDLMAAGAAKLGYKEARASEAQRETRAMIALEIAQQEQVRVIENEDLWLRLCETCARFLRAAPWKKAASKAPLWMEFSGDKLGSYEALVTGGEDDDCGVALYPERGALSRIERLTKAGKYEEAARMRSLGVVLAAEPEFALDPLDALCGLKRVPVPTRVEDGKRIPLSDEDMLGVIAALEAVIRVAAGEKAPVVQVEVGELAAEVKVRPLGSS